MTALAPAVVARLVAAALWALVGGSAMLSVVAVVLAAEGRPAGLPVPPDPTAAEALAQLAVLALLTAPEDGGQALRHLASSDADLSQVIDAGAVAHTLVAESRPAGGATWEVVVLAVAPGTRPRAYAVTVLDDGRTRALQGLPRRTRLPTTAAAPRGGLPPLDRPPAGDPLLAAATGFLRAYYTGSGDLDRFTGPGSGLAPVDPPAYTEVAIQRWSAAATSDTSVLALAELRGSAPNLVEVTQIPLLLAQPDSRWEVVDLPAALPVP